MNFTFFDVLPEIEMVSGLFFPHPFHVLHRLALSACSGDSSSLTVEACEPQASSLAWTNRWIQTYSSGRYNVLSVRRIRLVQFFNGGPPANAVLIRSGVRRFRPHLGSPNPNLSVTSPPPPPPPRDDGRFNEHCTQYRSRGETGGKTSRGNINGKCGDRSTVLYLLVTTIHSAAMWRHDLGLRPQPLLQHLVIAPRPVSSREVRNKLQRMVPLPLNPILTEIYLGVHVD